MTTHKYLFIIYNFDGVCLLLIQLFCGKNLKALSIGRSSLLLKSVLPCQIMSTIHQGTVMSPAYSLTVVGCECKTGKRQMR